MVNKPKISLSEGARGNGFAEMLVQLLSQNMEQNGERLRAFQGIKGRVSIEAPDLGEKVSLDFQGESLSVSLGLSPGSLLYIFADSITILDLARVKIRLGLPWFFDGVGLSILGKILTGRLKVKGMLSHPIILVRLTKVFSVV